LSTVDTIVRRTGGFATISSEPGGGSTFVVYLPRVADHAEGTETEQPEPARGTERILLVEDDSQVRELVLTILTARGYEVGAADSPETALAMLADESDYDLLLTDVVMPTMNGTELADRVSELQPGIRVLYVSGYTGNALVETASLAPGRAFVQKPFNARALSAKIRELLDADTTPVAA
jgi:CheY-like chemotaxis protein